MCCSDDFEEAWFQGRQYLGLILISITCLAGAGVALGLYASVIVDDMTKTAEQAPPPTRQSLARIIPQLYAANSTRVSSSRIRVQEDYDYRVAYCREFPPDRFGEIEALVQLDVSPDGLPEGLLEMRFEVPLIESTLQQSNVVRRCPAPMCSSADYRQGIGAGAQFYNAYATFLTDSRVTWNRKLGVPYPAACGCSAESPARFSCSLWISAPPVAVPANASTPGGNMAVWFRFTYPILYVNDE